MTRGNVQAIFSKAGKESQIGTSVAGYGEARDRPVVQYGHRLASGDVHGSGEWVLRTITRTKPMNACRRLTELTTRPAKFHSWNLLDVGCG